MFGHMPIRDLAGGTLCGHPMHKQVENWLNAPGVDIELPFEWQPLISDDDEPVVQAHEDYERQVEEARNRIREIEAEDERKRKGKQVW